MIPTGDVYEAVWKIFAGLLLGVLLGGFGGGLLVWAIGQWLRERARFLWTSAHITMAEPKEIAGNKSVGAPNLEPVDGQPG